MNGEDELVYLNFAGFQSLENMYHSSIDLYLSTCGLQNCFGGNMAERMLKETDHKILEIAQAVGYADQMSFSKAFKKYKNISPSEYRERSNL